MFWLIAERKNSKRGRGEQKWRIRLNISSSPHIRSKVTSSNIMLMVTIALLPASAFGVYNFGMDALLMLIVTTATAVLDRVYL